MSIYNCVARNISHCMADNTLRDSRIILMPENLEWLIFMKASHVSHSHDDSEAGEGTFLAGRIEIVLLFQICNLERSLSRG